MEVNVEFEGVQFHEDETTPPSDAMRVGTTWTYTNKNGTPDRRFAHNPVPLCVMDEFTGKSEWPV